MIAGREENAIQQHFMSGKCEVKHEPAYSLFLNFCKAGASLPFLWEDDSVDSVANLPPKLKKSPDSSDFILGVSLF